MLAAPILERRFELWYPYVFRASGNNSVVECDLAKVEVAGSNPVSRSNLRPHGTRAGYGWQGHSRTAGRHDDDDAPHPPLLLPRIDAAGSSSHSLIPTGAVAKW